MDARYEQVIWEEVGGERKYIAKPLRVCRDYIVQRYNANGDENSENEEDENIEI